MTSSFFPEAALQQRFHLQGTIYFKKKKKKVVAEVRLSCRLRTPSSVLADSLGISFMDHWNFVFVFDDYRAYISNFLFASQMSWCFC